MFFYFIYLFIYIYLYLFIFIYFNLGMGSDPPLPKVRRSQGGVLYEGVGGFTVKDKKIKR